MGIASSRPDEGAALFLRDPNRLSITSLVISNPRRRSSVNIVPNSFPATRVSASRSLGDNNPIEFVQDPEPSGTGAPSFILKLVNDEELVFTFTFVIRQAQTPAPAGAATDAVDTQIAGLTYVYASTPKEVDNLLTREFHADPNLHKNSNVELVGDFGTGGSSSVSFEWTWKWKPPKPTEDKGGWRNSCSFVEYDPRAHRLITLASFSYWVSSPPVPLSHPNSPTPPITLVAPPKVRIVSTTSVESRMSSADQEEPGSPVITAQDPSAPPVPPLPKEPVKIDVSCTKPGDDVAATDDGPVFRATIKALEQKTGNMRMQMKRVLKKAEHAQSSLVEANEAFASFMDALREASSTNANAVQPAIEHYFDKIAREILAYERQNATNLQKVIIDPLSKLYTFDIKQAESKKRDFEEESKEYYSYVSRYLGQRHDSVKAKKLAESDNKYQTKRRTFELKRFDYSSFMQDLHGGRKEQEVLSQLTRFADAQTKGFLSTAKRIDELLPQLQALYTEVQETDKEYQYQRREREEKRRLLEKGNLPYNDPDPTPSTASSGVPVSSNGTTTATDWDLGRADSTGSQLKAASSAGSNGTGATAVDLSRSPGGSVGQSSIGSLTQNTKFKGIRDLEERDHTQIANAEKNGTQRKEGLLWALNRPGGHVDPRTLNKPGWHKFWIVLDQGKLSEYSNWKQKLDLHMEPIDLRMASVREARNAERRFCFEVITPHFKRVYQATSEEDMNSWILSINNALQSAVEGRGLKDKPAPAPSPIESSSFKRDIGSILTGKSPSLSHGHGHGLHGHSPHHLSSSGAPVRRTTVGARPPNFRSNSSSFDENPTKLLQMIRDNDQGNTWCSDCGSQSKVEWVSINLAIILCIECSGIHRSLGTHISKVRSLTLDITSFTPDIVELLMLVGNRVSNMVWEAKLDPAAKPGPQATREQRLKFITAKYVDRAYVEPLAAGSSRYATADETLLAAIKTNDIQQVVYALALRANPNAADRSRGTLVVFLALAAVDPAAPSGPAAGAADADAKPVPFPVAEMLVQNGAEVPATAPPIPLGRRAQAYIEQKLGRSGVGGGAATGGAGAAGGSSLAPDAVGSLPAGSASPSERLAREREARLQKRVSAGGRLAKSPIPER